MDKPEKSPWYVVLTAPQQDIPLVWRLHELGLELYVPIVRLRVKTGRNGRNGQKVTRIVPRPMFPGYGFVRQLGITDLNRVRDVRGVREFLKDKGNPVLLPDAAILQIFRKQFDEHQSFLTVVGQRKRLFKPGQLVRVEDDGGVYSGMVATIDKLVGKDRLEVLFGMIRHTLRADMVVAA